MHAVRQTLTAEDHNTSAYVPTKEGEDEAEEEEEEEAAGEGDEDLEPEERERKKAEKLKKLWAENDYDSDQEDQKPASGSVQEEASGAGKRASPALLRLLNDLLA